MLISQSRVRSAALVGAAVALMAAPIAGWAQSFKITRNNLAKTAAFTVTRTTETKDGSKASSVIKVEVKGNKARAELADPQIGNIVYLANERGVFFYVPANKVAQQQPFKDGFDRVLQYAFREVNDRLKTAKKTGTAVVSGQTTDVYTHSKSGATLYISRNPAFRLPVKSVINNQGGRQTFLVSNIKTNITLPDTRFTVPKGVQVIEPNGAAGGQGLPR